MKKRSTGKPPGGDPADIAILPFSVYTAGECLKMGNKFLRQRPEKRNFSMTVWKISKARGILEEYPALC